MEQQIREDSAQKGERTWEETEEQGRWEAGNKFTGFVARRPSLKCKRREKKLKYN
jgi:hypothetical protein